MSGPPIQPQAGHNVLNRAGQPQMRLERTPSAAAFPAPPFPAQAHQNRADTSSHYTAGSPRPVISQGPTNGQTFTRDRRLTPRSTEDVRPVSVSDYAQSEKTGWISKLFSRSSRTPSQQGIIDLGNHNRKDRRNLRNVTILGLAFLIAFILLIANNIRKEQHTSHALTSDMLANEMQSDSRSASETIGMHVKWMETAQALRGANSQIINMAARAPNVTGVILRSDTGAVLGSYPQSAMVLENLAINDIPEKGVKLTSMISTGGVANPVIIRRQNNQYLVTSLAPGTLIGTHNQSGSTAIIAPGGKQLIDSSHALHSQSLSETFAVSPNQLSELSLQNNSLSLHAVKPSTGASILGAARIPNTDLTLLKSVSSDRVKLPSSLPLFLLLFGCTAALVLGLLYAMRRQIKKIRSSMQAGQAAQDRNRIAMEGGGGGVWEIDLQNNHVTLNSSLSKMLGLGESEHRLSVANYLALFQESDRERLLASVRRAHMSGILDIELGVAKLPLVLQCRGQSSIRNYNDGSSVIVGVAIDITEQRGAQARLQAAEARLFDALNSMSESFVIWDALDRLVLWNGKFTDFFGFKPGQLQQGLEENIVEHLAGQAIDHAAEVSGADNQIEIQLKDGRWIRYAEAKTADGGKVSIGSDITELRQREQDLRENDMALRNTVNVLKKSQSRIMELAENYEQEKIRAEDANQSKSDFLANMSHELRTPLNAINGFSDIMKKEMFGPLGDPRYKEYVSDILFSGQHLLSLINDILDMSKIEAGKMTLNTDLLQINEMISQVVRIVRGRAEEKRLKLVYEGEDFEEVEADQRAVKQVLLNLITNAIKFTPEGGTVTIDAERKKTGVIIRVIDSGIGISKENIERLAKPFEQIDNEHSKEQEGTGLGLALSKSLVELHGGNFVMESELGVGTTVIFTLPNKPLVQEKTEDNAVVGDEINRLAEDIANVLDQNQNLQNPTMDQPSLAPMQAAPYPAAPPPMPTQHPSAPMNATAYPAAPPAGGQGTAA